MPKLKTALLPLMFAAFAMPLGAQEAEAPQRVLAVFAHPDDELVVAPALAALARQGAEVTIVFATVGDQGAGVTNLPLGAELGELRRKEAQCSADALGVQADFFVGIGDGTMARTPQAERSPAQVFAVQFALGYLADPPDLILTWGPDGGYGHADHRMVSALATQAVQAMPAAERPKLLYVGIPAGSLPPVPQLQGWAVTDPALLTESIAYNPADLDAARAAAACHASQFDEATRAGIMPLFDASIWQGTVHFRKAF